MKQSPYTAVAIAAMVLCMPARAADVNSWSPSASANTTPAPNGFPDNISPSQVHGSIREIMASVRRLQQRFGAAVTSGGSANAQTLTYSIQPTSCVAGDVYMFIAGFTNTGAMTLNNGACTAAVKLGADALAGGEIVAGRAVMVTYDGAAWQLVSGGGGGGGGISAGAILINASGDLLLNASGDILLN